VLRFSVSGTLADAVLAEILARDPGNAEARKNRELLRRRAGWTVSD
jgi:hypothetical protein